jgi:hypothetical protein
MRRRSPSCQELAPLTVIFYVAAKNVLRRAGGFVREMQEVHPGLYQGPPSFAVITGRAGCDDVVPYMFTAEVAG